MPYQAILFDLDGTLIDNYHHWDNANKDFFTELGIPHAFDDREYVTMINGRSMHETVVLLKDRYKLPHSIEDLLQIKTRVTDRIYSDLSEPMPGAEQLLAEVRKKPFKTAIASGSPLSRIQMILDRFGWHDYFDTIVSVEHVNNVGKPDPAVFSYAAKQLNISPEGCVVLEDAQNGVKAAKAAGMACIAIAANDHEDYSAADERVYSLSDARLHAFLGL